MMRRLLALAATLVAFASFSLPAEAQTVDVIARGLAVNGLRAGVAASCGTVSVSTPCLDLSQAWTGTGTLTLLKANVSADPGPTNAASQLLDLQYLGASQVAIDRSGATAFGANRAFVGNFKSQVTGGLSGTAFYAPASGGFAWYNANSGGGTLDLALVRDAANTLACRNGTSACTAYAYNTFTDSSNYERGTLSWSAVANSFQVGTEAAGTGTLRAIIVKGQSINFSPGALGTTWTINSAGTLQVAPDGTYDIGGAGTARPRDLNLARDALVGRDISVARHLSSNGSAPAVTSCGTSPAIVGSDTAGEVTSGTATPTACTITFNVAYVAQPYCTVIDRSTLANLTSYTVSTTAIVITNTAASSQKFVYQCLGA